MRVMVWRMQVVDVPADSMKTDFTDRGEWYPGETLEAAETYLENNWVEYDSHEILSQDGQRIVRAEVLDSTIIVEEYVDDRLPVAK